MTDWTMPTDFPDLSAAKAIGVDIETRDETLKQSGPGVRRGGYVVGVSIVTYDKKFKAYYPIAHDEGPNLNKTAVVRWLRRELGRPEQPKIGANLLYDFDYLSAMGIRIEGDKWIDVQNAEPLIDENAVGGYNLDALGKKYLQREKLTGEIERVCKERKYKGKAQRHLWRLPASVVGPYAIEDADLPIDIYRKQQQILNDEGTTELFRMETFLMPLLLQMRQTGVRLNVTKLDRVIREMKTRAVETHRRLDRLAGFKVEVWAGSSLAKAFDANGLPYNLTPKTQQPSFTKDFLSGVEHPLGELVVECRRMDKFVGTFLEGQMRDQMIDGRLHALFNQLRSDSYGAVTGRFSSSHPNLQFIPKRDDELGPLCRSMFIPEEEHDWGRADYSQIEYRIFAHYARGPGSEAFRQQYRDDPTIDFHQWCADRAKTERQKAKTINFGMIYGMGVKKLAEGLGLELEEARPFLNGYHEALPFARKTLWHASDVAERRGYVKTIMNRRRRFVNWGPADMNLREKLSVRRNRGQCERELREFLQRQGDHNYSSGVRRVGTHKALNAVIQGSAADLMKKAMVDCYRAGLFNVLVPHLTVHDELDVSVPRTEAGREAYEEMVRMMEDAIPFSVPVLVDHSRSDNWGEAD